MASSIVNAIILSAGCAVPPSSTLGAIAIGFPNVLYSFLHRREGDDDDDDNDDDDDDEGDKRKSTLRPDNTAATKAAQKRKWEVSPYLSPLFSTLSLPLILSLPAFSNCSLFSKVLRRRRLTWQK